MIKLLHRWYVTREEYDILAARVRVLIAEQNRINAEAGYRPMPAPARHLTVLQGGKAAS